MKNFFIITNSYKDKGLRLTMELKNYIETKGGTCGYFTTMSEEETKKSVNPQSIPKETECIFVLGGDGTLIRAARDLVSLKIPMIGVNMGTLGYLCELEESTVFEAIDQIMTQHYMLEERMMISGVKTGETKELPKSRHTVALNDIVIHRCGALQIANLIVYVNGQYLATYNADGIIIATPTGSTGYSMSAGGPILDPKAKMLLITPISPHALNAKSIVISAEDHITIEVGKRRRQEDEQVVVSFDGDQVFSLQVGERIEICQTLETAKILKLTSQSFLEILQKKMQVYQM
jgi:NAD+ kinase